MILIRNRNSFTYNTDRK